MSTSSIHGPNCKSTVIYLFIYLNMKHFIVISSAIADPQKLCGAALTSERKERVWK